MNCRSCRDLIAGLVGGELPADLAGEVRSHAATCPACRLELALAGRIEQSLSRLESAPPPADFTARVMAALPALGPAALPFWPQALSILACAVSTLAVLHGLSHHLSEVGRLGEAGQAWVTGLVASPRLPFAAGEPGRLYAAVVWLQAWGSDAAASLAAYLQLLSGVYSKNAPGVNLAAVGAVLLWVLYDYSQRARA
jgi:anti-sigma factor RsiW